MDILSFFGGRTFRKWWGVAVPVTLHQGDGDLLAHGVEEVITGVWTCPQVFWFAISLATAGTSKQICAIKKREQDCIAHSVTSFAHVVLLSLLLDYCFLYLDDYVATENYTCWPHTLACLLVAERHTAVFWVSKTGLPILVLWFLPGLLFSAR
jgi:hypothetical protein